MNPSHLVPRWAAALAVCLAASAAQAASGGGVTAADTQQIKDLFFRQAAAESAHDINALADILAQPGPGEPDPVSFVARAYRFWGRPAVMEHFRKTFIGTWHMEPLPDQVRIIPLNAQTAQIYAPTRITLGPAGAPATTATFLINEFAIRTPQGWRISAIVPVPAQ
jgi:hypothetical protein